MSNQILDEQRYILRANLQAYINQYDEAMDRLDAGIDSHPESAHLYRWRGHYNIQRRMFDQAAEDFEDAVGFADDTPDVIEFFQDERVDEIERIIAGNDAKWFTEYIPVTEESISEFGGDYKTTFNMSLWYHYGLANYLRGEYEAAIDCYDNCLDYCIDDTMQVATIAWLYRSLRRAGHHAEANELVEQTNTGDMEILEPSYYRAVRLYKGELPPEDLLDVDQPGNFTTLAYGVGVWHFCNGDDEQARNVFEDILDAGEPHKFGHIAAEQDLNAL